MKDETYPCPGKSLHKDDGKCEFCGSDKGNPQSVESMPEIDRISGERLVKPCCKACANNLNRATEKQYVKTSVS